MKKGPLYSAIFFLVIIKPLLMLIVPDSFSEDEIQAGDLVFFWIDDRVRHVGIYLQDGKFFHSSTSEGVTVNNLDEDYWRYRLISARRVNHDISLKEFKRAYSRYDKARYGYGQRGPDRFDCSGLVWRVFADYDVDVPRSTRAQMGTSAMVISGKDFLKQYNQK